MKSSLRLVIIFGLIFVMSAPSWAEEINVCYNKRTGAMRYVDSPSDCRPNENSLLMNTEGPAGSDGIDGINTLQTAKNYAWENYGLILARFHS